MINIPNFNNYKRSSLVEDTTKQMELIAKHEEEFCKEYCNFTGLSPSEVEMVIQTETRDWKVITKIYFQRKETNETKTK